VHISALTYSHQQNNSASFGLAAVWCCGRGGHHGLASRLVLVDGARKLLATKYITVSDIASSSSSSSSSSSQPAILDD
jgi:hypothetical protein